MTANGFLEQKSVSPLSFGAVLMLHGAAIAAVLLVKGPEWISDRVVDTKTYNVRTIPPPPPNDPPPQPEQQQVVETPPMSRIDVPKQIVETPVRNIAVPPQRTITPPGPIAGNDPGPSGGGTRELVTVPPRVPDRTPVRVEAQFDPRFAGALQPPYPAAEQRAEREGEVRIRVTIGPDGRVVAAERVSAASDAFWRATERQALSRWRFRPATVDGRPVQSSKVLTVRFRLDG